jgi:hypothetical protein
MGRGDQGGEHQGQLTAWPYPVCDTHSHVFPGEGGRDLDDYLAAARSAGVARHVVVHAKASRHDPLFTPKTVARIGLARARGVVWDDARWNDADRRRLHQAGVRGIRFLFEGSEAVDLAAVRGTAERIAALGWHVLVQAGGDAWPSCAAKLAALPCPVVIDHIGRLAPDRLPGVPGAARLCARRRLGEALRAVLRHARRQCRLSLRGRSRAHARRCSARARGLGHELAAPEPACRTPARRGRGALDIGRSARLGPGRRRGPGA